MRLDTSHDCFAKNPCLVFLQARIWNTTNGWLGSPNSRASFAHTIMDDKKQAEVNSFMEDIRKEKDSSALKKIQVEHINILSKVKLTYKTPEGRLEALKCATDNAKRDKKRYGGDHSYTVTFEDTAHVKLND